MFTKILLVLLIILILGALFSGLYFLFRDYGKGERTLTALLFRIGFTLALIFVLLLSIGMGWIKLHAINSPIEQNLPHSNSQPADQG